MATGDQYLWVTRVLGVPFPSTVSAPDGSGNDALAKARQAWLVARKKVQADVSALQTAVVGSYAERGLGPKLAAAYQNEVAWVLNALDERVTEALDALVANGDDRRHAELRDEAREVIGDYKVFLATDKIVAGIDKNPFGVAVSVRATLSATLTAVDKVLA
jgi:hypothetical protein